MPTTRTPLGRFMYSLCDKGAKFLYKHKWLYYLLACTWGVIMTLLGLIISLVLLIFGRKPHKYHGIYYFQVGKGWGGLEMGLMFLTSKDASEYIRAHEYGHTFQNALLGPLFPILVGIPSAIRYWHREYLYKHNFQKYVALPKYDDIWFEGSATDIGKKYTEL